LSRYNDETKRAKLYGPRDRNERLRRNLAEAAKRIALGQDREAAFRATLAISRYLKDAGHAGNSLIVFERLLGALADADRGLKNPLATPNEHEGGRRKPIIDGKNMAHAAAAVTILNKSGIGLEEALRHVSRALPPLITLKRLKYHRNNLISHKSDRFFIDIYEHMARPPEAAASVESLREYANRIIAHLRVQHGRIA
jgi:hypothetical protein